MQASTLKKFSFLIMAILALSKTITPKPEERPYQPFGAALEVFYCQEDEVVTDGPAGTGKSRGCLEKMHFCAEKYKGMRGLLARKTRTSISQTALVTYEKYVLPVGSKVHFYTSDQEYRYPNGSVLVVGGLDKSSKIMSSEYDMIFIQEATELTEEDWEDLTSRLRNGVMPYQQLLADCNPQSPKHFLKQREKRGVLKMFPSRHEDNPVLFNHATGEMTERGKAYLAKLDNLTGVRYLRLRKGLWVQAEGLVWDNYNAAIHLIDSFEVPDEWRRFWVIDFGYVNPFTWQEWAMDPDGILYLIRQIYFTKRLVEDHAKQILQVTAGSPKPEAIICDHDREDRATLERHTGLATVPAYKDVSTGLQAVESRFKVKENGKAGIYIFRDSLVEIDTGLEDAKKPLCLQDELEGYVWKDKSTKEEPLKENDHGCDDLRYMVAWVDLRPKFEISDETRDALSSISL